MPLLSGWQAGAPGGRHSMILYTTQSRPLHSCRSARRHAALRCVHMPKGMLMTARGSASPAAACWLSKTLHSKCAQVAIGWSTQAEHQLPSRARSLTKCSAQALVPAAAACTAAGLNTTAHLQRAMRDVLTSARWWSCLCYRPFRAPCGRRLNMPPHTPRCPMPARLRQKATADWLPS